MSAFVYLLVLIVFMTGVVMALVAEAWDSKDPFFYVLFAGFLVIVIVFLSNAAYLVAGSTGFGYPMPASSLKNHAVYKVIQKVVQNPLKEKDNRLFVIFEDSEGQALFVELSPSGSQMTKATIGYYVKIHEDQETTFETLLSPLPLSP